MARNLRRPRYNPAYFTQLQNDPKIYAAPLRMAGLKGHDKISPISRLGEGYCRLVRNLAIRDGQYFTRDGTIVFGDPSAYPIVHAQEVILSNGSVHAIRFSTDNVYVLAGGVWVATTGAAWNTTDLRAFSITGWGDSVVFAEDTLGIFRLDFTGLFGKTLLVPLPGVKHLATFAGRIIASLDDRVQWSVKDNEADWSGLGSGYEDLRSAMNGRPDGQTAVVPLTDDTALVLRTSSVWLMRTTGNFDAPFQFTLLEQGKGCKWPRTVTAVSGGAIWLGDDGTIWSYGLNQYGQGVTNNIALPIYKLLQVGSAILRKASAVYDPRNDEYRLHIPDSSGGSTVQRFNRAVQVWTEDTYQFPIRSMAFAMYGLPITIDDLVGTIDSLVGAIDDLTLNQPATKIMFAMADPSKLVVLERKPTIMSNLDIDAGGSSIEGTMRIETGYINAADPLHRTELIQVLLEYEAQFDCTLTYYYSDDGGVSWNWLSNFPITTTSRPVQLTFDYPLDRQDLQFAIESQDMTSMHLIDLIAMARQGGTKADAN